MRYVYSVHKNQQAATLALEHMFAAGEVSEGEFPRVERWSVKGGNRYCITLAG
jgi:hypothetical protein